MRAHLDISAGVALDHFIFTDQSFFFSFPSGQPEWNMAIKTRIKDAQRRSVDIDKSRCKE